MKKKIVIIISLLLVIWLFLLIVNLMKVNNKQKPVMCFTSNLKKDGGSGHYICLGYSFDIEGDFNPESNNYGINKYSFSFFGIKIVKEKHI